MRAFDRSVQTRKQVPLKNMIAESSLKEKVRWRYLLDQPSRYETTANLYTFINFIIWKVFINLALFTSISIIIIDAASHESRRLRKDLIPGRRNLWHCLQGQTQENPLNHRCQKHQARIKRLRRSLHHSQVNLHPQITLASSQHHSVNFHINSASRTFSTKSTKTNLISSSNTPTTISKNTFLPKKIPFPNSKSSFSCINSFLELITVIPKESFTETSNPKIFL